MMIMDNLERITWRYDPHQQKDDKKTETQPTEQKPAYDSLANNEEFQYFMFRCERWEHVDD